ncbi:MAG: UDP-N-acetylmuramoyl-L-alanyl-D-glutamate--2,6-diaminopimelate ligase [Succinivibrionaceae bacterium]|nr:UDP-N-acetylmuramoyl-L-alanyl-D-glutamate--2,6-diaminopimelate ligase [Succinivibrionaceae bacterium]MEE1339159.1 UDP-N-acetylmuramoyl-L-alanyl-D-glutamate--2,6-diaminopimelate ligase [Succinivibrionaceae bacterium]
MKNLKDLAKIVGLEANDLAIDYLTDNTKDVKPNSLFIAYKGITFDAREHIDEIIKQGAVAVFYDDCDDFSYQGNANVLGVKNLAQYEAQLANFFFDNPSQKLKLVGVTGTNGKSTVTYLVSIILNALNTKCGLLGTLGNGFYPNLKTTTNTTQMPLKLQKNIKEILDEGAKAIAMEVSSHGLALGRVDNLHFLVAAFTNLTHDHLDFHKTMENYAQAKFQLFKKVSSSNCVINIDDKTGENFANQLDLSMVYTKDKNRYEDFKNKYPNLKHQVIYTEKIVYHNQGITLQINGDFGEEELNIGLLGSFNVENILCAIGILLKLGFTLSQIKSIENYIKPLKGRMELYKNHDGSDLVVDYAHTPDGLKRAIEALREHHYRKITVVCGCGGDRDKLKRPIMAKIASDLADHVIFTSDNPRNEEPWAILNMMLEGVKDKTNYQTIENRTLAIKEAFNSSTGDDVVLIAGKGHEDYQIIGNIKHHYSDRELAEELTGDKHD